MGSFIDLDGQELFNGELGVWKSSSDKIAFFELGKSFGIKLGLELFQNIREFCVSEGDRIKVSSALGYGYDRKHETETKENRKSVRTEDQEVRRRVLPLPRGSSHEERCG